MRPHAMGVLYGLSGLEALRHIFGYDQAIRCRVKTLHCEHLIYTSINTVDVCYLDS